MTTQLHDPAHHVMDARPDVEGRHERSDAAENRRRVLDSAQRLFQEFGVEAISMHQIAQAAAVGQGTLYRRYAHKGELVLDLLAESVGRFKDAAGTYLAETEGGAPARERLIGFLGLLVSFIDEKWPLLAAFGDACSGKRRGAQYRGTDYMWIHGTVARLMGEAVAGGEVRAVDPTFTADAILAALGPDVFQFQREDRGLTTEQILEGVTRIFL